MTQRTPLTSPRLLGHLPCLLAVLLATALTRPTPAGAEQISSVYTPLDLGACQDVTPADVKEYGTVWRCKGHDGVDVRVAEGDLRMFVSFGPNAEHQTVTYETLPQFNSIGDTLEWRVVRDGGRWTPFATILRYSWDVDGRKGSTLVVTKLGKDDACHVAYVEATGNAEANEEARAIADRDARAFTCKKDKAKTYGTGRE
jgi:hypothetical protein